LGARADLWHRHGGEDTTRKLLALVAVGEDGVRQELNGGFAA
jgi:hypothetical protein